VRTVRRSGLLTVLLGVSGLVGKVCAVETVDLLDSHAVLPGPSPVESGPSRLRRYGVDLRRC